MPQEAELPVACSCAPTDRESAILTPDDILLHLHSLTKPPGSLGRLEELAARLCGIQQSLRPRVRPRRLVLFAADHGVVAEGVSAWPSVVTGLMIRNIVAGGAASSVLARVTETDLRLVDVGAFSESLPACAGYHAEKVRAGTRNLAREPALTVAEFEQAWAVGEGHARQAARDGMCVVAAGEMGIGNSTSASCLAVLLADVPLDQAVGRGAGADDDTLARKREVVAKASGRARQKLASASREAIAAVAGLEIVAMAGFYVAAARAGLTVVLDGFIATSAALIAEHLVPETASALIAAHSSAEPGHAGTLRRLGLAPFIEGWQMRLGEGTGALLLMPLLDAAAAVSSGMATFRDAGITSDGR